MTENDRFLKRSRSQSNSTEKSSEKRNSFFLHRMMKFSEELSAGQRSFCLLNSESCRVFDDLRKRNLLCDGKISIQDSNDERFQEYSIHRFILAGSLNSVID